MRKPLKPLSSSFLRVLLAALVCLAPLYAQTPVNRAAADNTSSAQAPNDVTAKITTLVNAGNRVQNEITDMHRNIQ
jgi:hypothetical protein